MNQQGRNNRQDTDRGDQEDAMREPFHPHQDDFRLTDIFHALSDPIRLQIVQALADGGEESCSVFNYPLTKGTLSHHFKVLREAGLTHTRIEGRQRYITLRREELDRRFPGLLQIVITGEARVVRNGD